MPSKLVLKICFLTLFFLLASIRVQAQTICINLDIKAAPDLKISTDDVKKDLILRMEKEFSDRGILVANRESQSDYKLEGTIEVKHFIKSPGSYSILFKSKPLKITVLRYQALIPPLVFHPFTSRDRTGGVTPAQDIDDALDLSLNDLLQVMEKSEIFEFQNHPVFADLVKIEQEDLGKIRDKAELREMADRIIKELKHAIALALKTRPPQLPPPIITIKNNSAELKRILKEIEELKEQKKSINSMKKMLGKKLAAIDEISFVNIASIIMETNAVNAKFRSTFEAVIMPDQPCPECSEMQINAKNLGRIANEEDFNKFAREQQYRIPYRMKGKMVQDSSGNWKIMVSKSNYKKIFDIDRNGRLPKGTLIKSITDKTDLYPRILVKVGR